MGLYGDVVPTPTGALQTIGREEKQAKKETGLNRNAVNTFFSGGHLVDRKLLSDQAGFQRKEAFDEWETAKHDLNVLLKEAQEAKEREETTANEEDLEAWEESAGLR